MTSTCSLQQNKQEDPGSPVRQVVSPYMMRTEGLSPQSVSSVEDSCSSYGSPVPVAPLLLDNCGYGCSLFDRDDYGCGVDTEEDEEVSSYARHVVPPDEVSFSSSWMCVYDLDQVCASETTKQQQLPLYPIHPRRPGPPFAPPPLSSSYTEQRKGDDAFGPVGFFPRVVEWFQQEHSQQHDYSLSSWLSGSRRSDARFEWNGHLPLASAPVSCEAPAGRRRPRSQMSGAARRSITPFSMLPPMGPSPLQPISFHVNDIYDTEVVSFSVCVAHACSSRILVPFLVA
jgi:hypothetical protein